MNRGFDIVFPATFTPDQDREEIIRRFRVVGLNSIVAYAEMGYALKVGHMRELYQVEARKKRDAA